jgi:AbrB family looped-hinge helix DNA binding protein
MAEQAKRYAGAVRVGEKGQIVIPKQIRALFSIKPGDNLLILADTSQGIAIVKDEVLFDQFTGKLGVIVEESGEDGK